MIKSNQPKENFFHVSFFSITRRRAFFVGDRFLSDRSSNGKNSFSNSCRILAAATLPARGRAMITASNPTVKPGRRWRKNSRMVRFTRHRTTALPTLRLTVKPIRLPPVFARLSIAVAGTEFVCCVSATETSRAKRRKQAETDLRPEAVTARNSADVNNRADFGKR